VHVIPNYVDKALFLVEPKPAEPPRLLFLGHLDVRHNIDAARYMVEEIMPLVLNKEPTCRLQIAGAGNTRNVIPLADHPSVEIAGYVPDLRSIFVQSMVSVAPLRFSAGTQNKVIESMAAGLPVVATDNVCRGIDAKPDVHLLQGDNAAEFADQVVCLLRDEVLRQRIGHAGREFARKNFSSRSLVNRLQAIAGHID
jgi:glycosyltransferase involved in cell wall biosynthesis